MTKNIFSFNKRWFLIFTFLYSATCLCVALPKSKNIVSYVDTSLDGSQKYVLRVDGKPFYMLNIQLRLDNMRYAPGWTKAKTEAVIRQAASDGFNIVSIPIHWREVEPCKDKFDWMVIDEYLELTNKYNLKMEMLWFGTNSGGQVQPLGKSGYLRTPDYVLYSPEKDELYAASRKKAATTSEFTINRKMSDYSLDLADNNLRIRETYVLSKVMAHIAEWDRENGSRRPLVGVQIGNEVIGIRQPYPNSLVISYLSDVASAVKNSDYVVWTRVNCVFWKIPARIIENEDLRVTPQRTNLDFVGIDTYRHHFATDELFVASMRNNLPYIGKNYRMIMETNSNIPVSAQMHLAALSGNNAFDYYDFSGIYNPANVQPTGGHIEDIRLVNKILGSDIYDIATNAHGYGLFVHNWEGINSKASTSSDGIAFVPAHPSSQAVSIIRSLTEIVLMTTKGGKFILPDSLNITGASKGYFDGNNKWVEQEKISVENKDVSLSLESGTTMLLTRQNVETKAQTILQAEFAKTGGGATVEAGIEGIGFAGNGYVRFPSIGGAYIKWLNLDGFSGGNKTLKIRYSNGNTKASKFIFDINGKTEVIYLQPTGSWRTYRYFVINADLNSGNNNTILLESADNSIRINKVVYYGNCAYIDELQIFADNIHIAKYKDDKSCAISFTFDDGLQEHYTLVYPQLEKYGFKGTFWIVGNIIENESANLGKPRMTWAEMKEMSRGEHEISNHSWSHPNFCRLTEEQMRAEIDKTDSVIFQNIGVVPRTFCYPGNSFNDGVVRVASENKVGTRTFQYSIGGEKAKSTPDSLSAWLKRLISLHEWGVTMTHGITYGYDFFENPDILWDFFSEVKAREDSVWVATFAEVAAYVNECDNTSLDIQQESGKWLVIPHCSLDKTIFREQLTAVIPIKGIKKISANQNGGKLKTTVLPDMVMFDFDPFGGNIDIQIKN